MGIQIAEKRIQSVGIDIGTSTSHLIFSELVLSRDPNSNTEKFFVSDRIIKYRSQIIFTPLLDTNKIDIDNLLPYLLDEYQNAKINPDEIDTGAVIITGESARRENAEKIVEILAKESGNFVASTAGPNFESIISAHGSGAVIHSERNNYKIIHSDVGGGTSNIAVIDNGIITSTACINIGGRLITLDDEEKIIRLEPAGIQTLKDCNLNKNIGDLLTRNEKEVVSEKLAEILIDLLIGKKPTELGRNLLLTDALPQESYSNDPILSFSGGVAEYIYQKTKQNYNDLGKSLGESIRKLIEKKQLKMAETPEKIRATVIGASGHTLNVSGSTTFISKNRSKIKLPKHNIPIVQPTIRRENLSVEYISSQINKSLQRLDILEGEDLFALSFIDPVRSVYKKLSIFSQGVVKALPMTLKNNQPIYLIFNTDIGNSVGNVMKRETGIDNEIISLDEIDVSEGQFIDIGEPLFGDRVFPIVVKSLIFG
ncbi:MAG: ethanolamine ammonia-lyase reactivating factor EutA [Candidatus Hodarchaeales archaeon]|jgi:ethanolamine utilization protein EutA